MRPLKSREFSLTDGRRGSWRDSKQAKDSLCPGWLEDGEGKRAKRNVDETLAAESGL